MREIVLDTETTGLYPKDGHRIIQVAAIEIKNRKIESSLTFKVNPEREVDPRAAAVHGMTWDDLKDEPTMYECMNQLLNFIQGDPLVIHNADFDMMHLQNEVNLWNKKVANLADKVYIKHHDDPFEGGGSKINNNPDLIYKPYEYKINNPVFCTLKYLRHRDGVDKFAKGYKLEEQCAKYGIEDTRDKHDAFEDAMMLAKLYLAITEPFVKIYD